MKNEKTPAFSRQIGNLRITVWRNVGRDGGVFHTTQIVRRYKDSEGAWRDAPGLSGLGDIASARAGLKLATDFVVSAEIQSPAAEEEW